MTVPNSESPKTTQGRCRLEPAMADTSLGDHRTTNHHPPPRFSHFLPQGPTSPLKSPAMNDHQLRARLIHVTGQGQLDICPSELVPLTRLCSCITLHSTQLLTSPPLPPIISSVMEISNTRGSVKRKQTPYPPPAPGTPPSLGLGP